MTTSPSSKEIHLSREAAMALSSLKQRLDRYKRRGYEDLAHQCTLEMLEIANISTLEALASNDFSSDDILMFAEIPERLASPQHKKVHLNLLLSVNSSLAGEIIEVLKKHMKEGETHE
jgi:hypothetical protein